MHRLLLPAIAAVLAWGHAGAQTLILSGGNASNAATGTFGLAAGSFTVQSTGATYSWLTSTAGTDLPAYAVTDSGSGGILANDAAASKMTDGPGAAGGGTYSAFGTYGGAAALGTAAAEFDLKSVYDISSVLLSVQVSGTSGSNSKGVGLVQVYTSTDGADFSLWGSLLPATAAAAAQNYTLTVTGAPAAARYVVVVTSRDPSVAGDAGSAYTQQILGEMLIEGAAVPEPSPGAQALLGSGALLGFFLAGRLGRRTGAPGRT